LLLYFYICGYNLKIKYEKENELGNFMKICSLKGSRDFHIGILTAHLHEKNEKTIIFERSDNKQPLIFESDYANEIYETFKNLQIETEIIEEKEQKETKLSISGEFIVIQRDNDKPK